MRVLALDACGRFAVSAIRVADAEAIYAIGETGAGAVRGVYSSVDRVLAAAALTPADLDAIVVNTGPGSWTATRIAVTYTAGLAFGAGRKVFGFSGFAIGAGQGGPVAFKDQLGKLVTESGRDGAEARIIDLFPESAADDFLAARKTWLDHMLHMGAAALTSGEAGDPLALQTTYFQEFLAGARS